MLSNQGIPIVQGFNPLQINHTLLLIVAVVTAIIVAVAMPGGKRRK